MSELTRMLKHELRDREYREGYDEAFLDHLVATQIRVVREQRGLTQGQLANKASMKQSRISAIEDEDYGSWTVNTLRRVAYALGVRLRVHLEEWGTLLDDVEEAGRGDLERRPFEEDPVFKDSDPVPDNVRSFSLRSFSSLFVAPSLEEKKRGWEDTSRPKSAADARKMFRRQNAVGSRTG